MSGDGKVSGIPPLNFCSIDDGGSVKINDVGPFQMEVIWLLSLRSKSANPLKVIPKAAYVYPRMCEMRGRIEPRSDIGVIVSTIFECRPRDKSFLRLEKCQSLLHPYSSRR
jgi:hypothetical protein